MTYTISGKVTTLNKPVSGYYQNKDIEKNIIWKDEKL